MFQDTASALFGIAGLQVIDAEAGPGGVVTVWAVTDHADAAACPDCGTVSGRPHEMVVTRPRDVRRGLDRLDVRWVKRRWKCPDGDCGRKTFTESLREVPAGCRLTGRLRQLLGAEVTGRGCTPAEAARWQHVSWPTAHAAFIRQADSVLAAPVSPVAHLGIDEHRRGRPRFGLDVSDDHGSLSKIHDLRSRGPLCYRAAPTPASRRRIASCRPPRSVARRESRTVSTRQHCPGYCKNFEKPVSVSGRPWSMELYSAGQEAHGAGPRCD